MSTARLAPWLVIAAVSLFPAPDLVRAQLLPGPPHPLDFAARADALEAGRATSDALVMATILRRGLGQSERADADTERFLSKLAEDPQASASAALTYLDEVLGPAASTDPARWEPALRRFLSLLPDATDSHLLGSARARTEILLAAHLWQASCPLDPAGRSDGACIERIDAVKEHQARARAEREAARSAGRPYVPSTEPCYEPPRFRYVVYARRPALARESQSLLTRALRRAGSLPQDAALREALAHARFLQAEPRFEATLARRIPQKRIRVLPKQRILVSTKEFRSWYESRLAGATQVREQALYDTVLAYDVPAWSAAARTRLVQLLLDADDQLSHAPPRKWKLPHGLPRAYAFRYHAEVLCEAGDSYFEEPIRKALSECQDATLAQSLDDPYARTCRELVRSFHLPGAYGDQEIFAPPTWEAPLAQARIVPSDHER